MRIIEVNPVLRTTIAMAVVLFCLIPTVLCAESTVDPEKGIPLFLKIATFDESFKFDKSKTVHIGVIYEQSNDRSYRQFLAARDFFEKRPDLNVNDALVVFTPVPIDRVDSLLESLNEDDYNILIVTSVADELIRHLAKKKQDRNVRTFTFDPSLVPLGIAVSIRPQRKRTPILVNLLEAQLEGSNFGAHLLKMCEIYEK